MEISSLALPGVMLLVPRRFDDGRGYFAETFRTDLFARACGDWNFVQDNESRSVKTGTIRGLHFQCAPHPQGKLVRCTAGALYDVIVDIRRGSPTYGQWLSETLTPENGKQLWVPPGFAHGFCSLAPDTVICYKVTNYYSVDCYKGIAWHDPALGVIWPDVADPETLSDKDRVMPHLADIPAYFDWNG
jgi:dTDP-4-dehydrorhamnose 3,5-epimerase